MVLEMADGEQSIEFIAADLAGGDKKSLEMNRRDLQITRIVSGDAPSFEPAYQRLWAEFGAQHEMESREVILRRLAWHPATLVQGCHLRYEMIVVGHEGRLVAVRDQTAVATTLTGTPHAVVHLSHVLVEPEWRRTGLAGWLRAWPLQTARACLAAAGFSSTSRITLVAEMEPPDPQFPHRLVRLKAYEKAGFRKVDPAGVNYFQPDFRTPQEIDASGGPQPLSFSLVLRRVGREEEQLIRGAELREVVECLYRVYATTFRPQDMAGVWQTLNEYPVADAEIPLVPPSQ
jgi:GNAT superfamily N-acetyltransferase